MDRDRGATGLATLFSTALTEHSLGLGAQEAQITQQRPAGTEEAGRSCTASQPGRKQVSGRAASGGRMVRRGSSPPREKDPAPTPPSAS